MTKNITICDACGNGINGDRSDIRHSFRLSVVTILNFGDVTFPEQLEPPFDQPKDFCNLGCLKAWTAFKTEDRK